MPHIQSVNLFTELKIYSKDKWNRRLSTFLSEHQIAEKKYKSQTELVHGNLPIIAPLNVSLKEIKKAAVKQAYDVIATLVERNLITQIGEYVYLLQMVGMDLETNTCVDVKTLTEVGIGPKFNHPSGWKPNVDSVRQRYALLISVLPSGELTSSKREELNDVIQKYTKSNFRFLSQEGELNSFTLHMSK